MWKTDTERLKVLKQALKDPKFRLARIRKGNEFAPKTYAHE